MDERKQPEREADLMAAYVNGDKQAFRELFRIVAPQVYGFLLRKCGSAALAEDMLQTTFLKVHRARKDYRIGFPVRPWLFTIAARVRLDELRRQGRRPEIGDPEQVERAADGLAKAPSPVEQVERDDVAAKVREALGELPESQRVVVLLHRYEGLTFEQIGEALGTTEGAVKLRAFRAYERLRKQLLPLLGDDFAWDG